MRSRSPTAALPWLTETDPFPALEQAWGTNSPAPGLLAASEHMDDRRVEQAYRQGIFPWYGSGQPVLWWSPDPRMVLRPAAFRLQRSLRQSLRHWLAQENVRLVFDHDFQQVMARCASQPRAGQNGTWILPEMVDAYTALHRRGLAHSAELWQKDQLLAGLYFVAIGQAVFGESMFTRVRDGSKIALCLLVSVARVRGVSLIDCQQNTRHLASLGACEMPRQAFVENLKTSLQQPTIDWPNEALYWDALTDTTP